MRRSSTLNSSQPRSPLVLTVRWSALALSTVFASAAWAVDVEPLRLELTGAPGQTVTGMLTLMNRGTGAVRVTAQPGPYRYLFTAQTVPPQDPAARRLPSCEGWLAAAAADAPVAAGAAAILPYTVTIPEEAGQQAAAEYVAALVIDEQPADPGPTPGPERAPGAGTITVRSRIAIPVYLFLAGHEPAQGRIAAFQAEAGPQPGVVMLRLTLTNDGPVHLRPSGNVLVTDRQGGVIARLPLGRVIPIFPRFQEGVPLLLPLEAGRYTAAATVDSGGREPLQQTVSFEVLPDGRVQHAKG